jgi:hypothetical protein
MKRPSKSNDQYSEQETQQRFEAALRAALSTPPKPLKDIPKKYPPKKAPN